MSSPITIVAAADNRYALPLAVLLRSIQIHCSDPESLRFCVLDMGLSEANRQRVARAVDLVATTRLQWLSIEPQRFADLPLREHLTPAIYARLLIPDLLPKSTKALYFDADIIVVDDVVKLWNALSPEDLLCAVQDPGAPLVSSELGLANYRELGLSPQTKYFNSGVLAINLERFRTEGLGRQALDYVRRHRETIHFPDQDALNAVVAGRWRPLPRRWNFMLLPDARQEWPGLDDISVLHFVWTKPWFYDCTHPARPVFQSLLDDLPWPPIARATTWGRWQVERIAYKIRDRLRSFPLLKRGYHVARALYGAS